MRLRGVVLAALVGSVAAQAFAAPGGGEINSLFDEACGLYEASEFEGALRIFESIVSSGVRHPAVYYNLANCYYQQGEIGKAVANYRRARLLSPRDEDVRANLAFLRSSIGFQDTTGSFGLDRVARIPREIASPKEWRLVFYVAYYLGILCFLGVLFLSGGARRQALRALSVLIVVAIVAWVIAEHGLSRFTNPDEGVVVIDRSEFMSGPGAAFDELARLPDGVEVELRARSGIWVEVQLQTGEIGWVREQNLETI
jgi:tetratricopeptide (TPR) repeat protein